MAMETSSKSNRIDIIDDPEPIRREQIDAEKLQHHEINERAKPEELQYGEDILTWFLHDLGSVEVPVQHCHKIKGDNPIYNSPRMMSLIYNQVVESEVNKMLEAEVILLASSA